MFVLIPIVIYLLIVLYFSLPVSDFIGSVIAIPLIPGYFVAFIFSMENIHNINRELIFVANSIFYYLIILLFLYYYNSKQSLSPED